MRLLYFTIFALFVNILFAQEFKIGEQEHLSTCNTNFYDAGGVDNFAGNDYKMSKISSSNRTLLKINFAEFDLGLSAILKILLIVIKI